MRFDDDVPVTSFGTENSTPGDNKHLTSHSQAFQLSGIPQPPEIITTPFLFVIISLFLIFCGIYFSSSNM